MADSDAGDPVCWLERLCPECRAMPTEESPRVCWRCGAPIPPESGSDDPA
jgi:predicted amidophosphoribosyltransferase